MVSLYPVKFLLSNRSCFFENLRNDEKDSSEIEADKLWSQHRRYVQPSCSLGSSEIAANFKILYPTFFVYAPLAIPIFLVAEVYIGVNTVYERTIGFKASYNLFLGLHFMTWFS